MDTKQPLTLFVVAILAASVFSVAGLIGLPLQTASAVVTIETSADDHDDMFFGEGMLQVIIEDTAADDDSDDSIDVQVTSEGVSQTITVDDTTDGSQRFEFFIVHTDAVDKTPANPEDGADAESATEADDAILEFGTGAGADELDNGIALYESTNFDIKFSGTTVTIDYDESAGKLTIDRTTPYGSTSKVHLFIEDQDANLDPTDDGAFTVTDAELDDIADALFEATGAAFVDDVTFDETGDNSAIFEAILQLTTAGSGTDDELDFATETVTLQLFDEVIYDDPANGNNTSTDSSEVSFTVEDNDGTVDDIPSVTFGTEIKVMVRDDDQNIDSDDSDSIDDALTVEVDNAGGDSEAVDLEETDDNTGVFEFDLSNSELRVSFLDDAGGVTANNGILELRSEDISEDLVVSYEDPLDDDSTSSVVAEFTITLDLTPGALTAPSEAGVTDEFTVTLTDADLNDNPRTKDSYSFELDDLGPWPLMKGGLEYGEVYTLDLEAAGDALDFGPFGGAGGSNVTLTMSETGINTGVFTFKIDVEDITDFGDGGDEFNLDDGDDIIVSIDDCMDDPADCDEDDVSITIGRPTVGLDFSRTSVPIPPEDGSKVADEVGDAVITTLTLVDPTLATQSSVEETKAFVFGTDGGEFTLEVDSDDLEAVTIESNDEFYGSDAGADCDGDTSGAVDETEIVAGVSLCEVLTPNALDETGKATGVFESELEFSLAGVDPDDLDSQDFQDSTFSFTYTNDAGDEETSGFTFRGSDGIVSVDQPSAKAGTVVTITVEDEDLNIDDGEVDSFSSGDVDTVTGGIQAILLVETEDEEIAGVDDQDFEETGDDTGVFTAEFIVGDDIPVTVLNEDGDQVEQATNILITYDDEIDSSGGSGDELEVNIALTSGTGSLQVSPDLVGPATKITVLIADTDLDEDPDAVDDYESTDPNGDNFFISFASSRNEVHEASPDIEETGANTGVFRFTIELRTDKDLCADDDLSDEANLEAKGGDTDSSIGVCPGDLIAVRYEDEITASGNSAVVSEIVEVKSFDPEFVADKESYNVGDRVTISISDPDANRDADISDSLRDIRVISDSDRVGQEFSAIETGKDTGVFRLAFGTSAGSAGGAITVKNGDDITVRYTDDFPADFEASEEDKDFEFTVPIGGVAGGAAAVSPPEPQDVTGKKLTQINSGQQVVLTTNVINKGANSQPFVALVEVRDSSDVTVYLAWQTGTLPVNGQTNVGLSWTPDQAGSYEVRTFVISSLSKPDILSTVAKTPITVS
jgi:hypothetical protein